MTLSWTALADSPVGSDSGSLVCVDGKLYALEGRSYNDQPMYVYDIATNAWSALDLSNKPTLWNTAGIALGTTIWYVDSYNWAWVSYDTLSNTWADPIFFDDVLLSFPNDFNLQYKAALVHVAGVLYTYGTRNTGTGDEGGLLSFDIGSTSQNLSSPSSHKTFDRTLVGDGTRIYAVEGYSGGWDSEGIQSSTQRDTGVMEFYSILGDEWSFSFHTDPQYRNDHVAVFWEGAIYVIGGGSDDNNFPDGYAVPWVSVYDVATDTWTVETNLDQARSEPQVAVDPTTGLLYVWGGYGNFNDPSSSLVRAQLTAPGPPPPPPNPDLRVFIYDLPNAAYLPVT